MSAAEGRQEIVKRYLVGQVFDREAQRPTGAGFFVEQVVGTDAGVV